MTDEHVLHALDGSNPLAFLAALGTLRLASLEMNADIQMSWERRDGFWRPKLRPIAISKEELCKNLISSTLWAPVGDFIQSLESKNITVPVDKFQPFVDRACEFARPEDRRNADYAAAFGSEGCEEEDNNRIDRTAFCFITGSGHQDFLGTVVELAQRVTSERIYDALFGEWKAEKKCSMRWDPADAAEYALQWDDPGPKGAWSVWGANRLAFEALPCFPTTPVKLGMQKVRLQTTGFYRRNRQDEFTWPIWESFIGLATARSLVSHPELQEEAPDRAMLRDMGVMELYRARRVRIGQGANFKISFRPARVV